jgi:hypothetical protein
MTGLVYNFQQSSGGLSSKGVSVGSYSGFGSKMQSNNPKIVVQN